MSKQHSDAYSSDFANQTSPAINDAIDQRFSPFIATYIKQQWAMPPISR